MLIKCGLGKLVAACRIGRSQDMGVKGQISIKIDQSSHPYLP
jgi:hypothetical protein